MVLVHDLYTLLLLFLLLLLSLSLFFYSILVLVVVIAPHSKHTDPVVDPFLSPTLPALQLGSLPSRTSTVHIHNTISTAAVRVLPENDLLRR